MHKLRFRVWDTKLNKHWYGNDPAVIQGLIFGDTRYVVEQFTGLHDKDNREIYAGDVLLYAPYHNLGHLEKREKAVVVWGETGDSDGYSHGHHYEWTVGTDSLADVADSENAQEAYCEVIGHMHKEREREESNGK